MDIYENQYSKEFRMYMEYALQRYLCEKENYTEEDAKLAVAQDYDAVYQRAKEAKFL